MAKYTLEIFLGYGEITRDCSNGRVVQGAGGDGAQWLFIENDDIEALKRQSLPDDDASISEIRRGEKWYVAELEHGQWRHENYKAFNA